MKSEELDRILDDALASYSRQEPREGLEMRVVARVRTDGRAAPRWPWWCLAAVALTCLALALVRVPSRPSAQQALDVAPAVPIPPPLSPALTARRETRPGPSRLTAEEHALLAFAHLSPEAARRLAEPDKPLQIEAINIQPLQIDGLEIGEIK